MYKIAMMKLSIDFMNDHQAHIDFLNSNFHDRLAQQKAARAAAGREWVHEAQKKKSNDNLRVGAGLALGTIAAGMLIHNHLQNRKRKQQQQQGY